MPQKKNDNLIYPGKTMSGARDREEAEEAVDVPGGASARPSQRINVSNLPKELLNKVKASIKEVFRFPADIGERIRDKGLEHYDPSAGMDEDKRPTPENVHKMLESRKNKPKQKIHLKQTFKHTTKKEIRED